jgi:tetratricopeptide (TPR) repeat protein
VGKCTTWCQVKYEGKVGWVSRRYLAPIGSPKAPPKPTIVSTDPVADCNSDDSARRLAGCTALIAKNSLEPPILGIAYSRRSDTYLDDGNLEAAITDRAKALELQPEDAAYKARLAHSYLRRAAIWPLPAKIDAAIHDYSEAIRILPSNHDAYARRSSLYVLKSDYDSAITDIRAALAHQKGDKIVYELALAQLCESRGVQHLLKKEFDQAITRFTEGIVLQPSREDLYMHRASAYALKDEVALALKDYAEVIRINPDNVEAHIGHGELHRRQLALGAAHAAFDEAVKRQPSNVIALMFRGLTREDSRDREGAIADYQAVLKLNTKRKLAKAGIERLRAPVEPSAAGRDSEPPVESPPRQKRARPASLRACCIAYCRAVSCNSPPLPEACSVENLAYYRSMGIAAAKKNYMAGARNILGSSVSIPECED